MNQENRQTEPGNENPEKRELRRLPVLFARHIGRMPHWQKIVLVAALVAGAIGVLHRTVQPAARGPSASGSARISAPHSGAFDEGPGTSVDSGSEPADSGPTTPWFGRIGISVVVGFILGWLGRMFLRMMATIAALFALLLGGLSYFHVVNVDFSAAAKRDYHSASAWISDQAGKVKDAVVSHVPSTGGAVVGLWMGARRRK